jgi:hypothetical protein
MPVANCHPVDELSPVVDLWPDKPCPKVGATVVGMATAGATGGSAWDAWVKGVTAICGSRLQDTRVLPMFGPHRVKTNVLLCLDLL